MRVVTPAHKETAFQTALKAVDAEIWYILDNEESFLETFGRGNIMMLTDVSFSDTHVKMVYGLVSGQHVSGSITVAEYLEWR